jgi:hypothetical protein
MVSNRFPVHKINRPHDPFRACVPDTRAAGNSGVAGDDMAKQTGHPERIKGLAVNRLF